MHSAIRRLTAVTAAFFVLLAFTLQAVALDNKYRFDELKMAVSVPKEFYVITRDSERSDPVFDTLKLNYDETIAAFNNTDIYLRAYDPEQTYWLSVIVTKTAESKTINNYSDISAADRKGILHTLKSDPSIESAVEKKHNKNIFFDTTGTTASGDAITYVQQSNTVINGMQIDLILQKPDKEIVPAEAKALTNLANSLEFDSIRRTTGPTFDWWRLLLWVLVLAGLAIALSLLYRNRNSAKLRKKEQEKLQAEPAAADGAVPETKPQNINEALGYQDDEQFMNRASSDLDTYDIKVKEKNPMGGIEFFEDKGDSIDDSTDYFDTYFTEPTEPRSGVKRFFSAIGTYIKLAFKRLGYFFKNLKNKLFKRKKK